MQIAFIDVEGGHGGSSRSLMHLVDALLPLGVRPIVICRREGPAAQHYRARGVTVAVETNLPVWRALKVREGWWVRHEAASLVRFLKKLPASAGPLLRLIRLARRVDFMHFNHESLVPCARAVRALTRTPSFIHVRTTPYENTAFRFLARCLDSACDSLVFISEPIANLYERLGYTGPGSVLYNIVPMSEAPSKVDPHIEGNGRLKAVSLGKYDLLKGTARLLEIAEAVARRDRGAVLFVVAGDMTRPASEGGGNFADAVAAAGYDDMFLFLGHTDTPESVVAACDVCVKPSLDDEPWGRDMLESMTLGKPVVATGTDETFVESGVTGELVADYDPDRYADILLGYARDRTRLARHGAAARERVGTLCDPDTQARAFLSLVRQEIAERTGTRRPGGAEAA